MAWLKLPTLAATQEHFPDNDLLVSEIDVLIVWGVPFSFIDLKQTDTLTASV